jgi:FG-GAP-like repeat
VSTVSLHLARLECASTTEEGHDEVYYIVSGGAYDPKTLAMISRVSERGPDDAHGADADRKDGHFTAWDLNDSGDLQNRQLDQTLHSFDLDGNDAAKIGVALLESDGWDYAEVLKAVAAIGGVVGDAIAGDEKVSKLLDRFVDKLAALIPKNEDDHLGTFAFHVTATPSGPVLSSIVSDSRSTIESGGQPGTVDPIVVRFRGDGADYRATFVLGGLVPARPPRPGWRVVGIADFDNDGIVDLAWRRQDDSGEVRLWLLDGAGNVKQDLGLPAPDPGWRVVGIADFDNDGIVDLAWRRQDDSGEVRLWLLDGAGNVKQDLGLPLPANA